MPPATAATIGRYAVLQVLGKGGMGTVFAVYDERLDRRVALKLVNTEDERARARALREGQAMAKLGHPNVVPIFEVGDHEGQIFIAMEYVQGMTLREWNEAAARSWSEVVDKYLEAGRGLAAAHAVDLVHRDFKPDNAVVGLDDRVRVLDFGLAARRRGEEDTISSEDDLPITESRGQLDTPLTRTGATLGTPAYMAPEQYRGERADHRADQFALCVSLWEALFGRRPFGGDTRYEVFSNIVHGRVTEPERSDVPSSLRTILLRGLAADPALRWPDLGALLSALEEARHGRSPRLRYLLGAAALVVGLGWWGLELYQRRAQAHREEACRAEGAAATSRAWSPEARELVDRSLRDTGMQYSQKAAVDAAAGLDAYARQLQEAHTEVCLYAVNERWEPELVERSRWCLDQRLATMESLVGLLGDADAKIATRAISAVMALAKVEACLDPDRLERQPDPPSTTDAEAIAGLQRKLGEVESRLALGRYADGLELARAVKVEAEALGLPVQQAQGHLLEGQALEREGRYEEAKAVLADAYFAAKRADATEIEARAASTQAIVVGYHLADPEQGRLWARLSSHALDVLGVGDDDLQRTSLLSFAGIVHLRADEHAEAREQFERSLAIVRAVEGPEHPNAAIILNLIGNVHYDAAEDELALARYEEALAIHERVHGAHHPTVGQDLERIASVLRYTGDLPRAQLLLRRSLEIQRGALGDDHPGVAGALQTYAAVLWTSGRAEAAYEPQREALEIYERTLGPDNPVVATSLEMLGNIELDRGHPQAAVEHYRRSLAIREATVGPEHLDVATSLELLAGALCETDGCQEAPPLLERAQTIRESGQGPEHGDVANTISLRARAHRTLGDAGLALELAERAVRRFAADEGLHRGEPAAQQLLAELLDDAGQRARALDLARRALAGYRELGKGLEPEAKRLQVWIDG